MNAVLKVISKAAEYAAIIYTFVGCCKLVQAYNMLVSILCNTRTTFCVFLCN